MKTIVIVLALLMNGWLRFGIGIVIGIGGGLIAIVLLVRMGVSHLIGRFMNWVIIALLIFQVGCMNRFQRIEDYQEKATKACELHHSPEECRVLRYPSEE